MPKVRTILAAAILCIGVTPLQALGQRAHDVAVGARHEAIEQFDNRDLAA